jgi:hypothetical protein
MTSQKHLKRQRKDATRFEQRVTAYLRHRESDWRWLAVVFVVVGVLLLAAINRSGNWIGSLILLAFAVPALYICWWALVGQPNLARRYGLICKSCGAPLDSFRIRPTFERDPLHYGRIPKICPHCNAAVDPGEYDNNT